MIINKKLKKNYSLSKRYLAGLSLFGLEVKSLRNNEASLENAYIICSKNEFWIINLYIADYKYNQSTLNYDAYRRRKLLLNRLEIQKILLKIKQEKLILIPEKIFLKNNFFKLSFYLGKRLKKYDLREKIKKSEINKSLQKKYHHKI